MLERDVLNSNPAVKWNDVAGLSEAKRLLQEAVVFPLLFPDYFTVIVCILLCSPLLVQT
jgi:katanin p60 ATPase-containing subunit A1